MSDYVKSSTTSQHQIRRLFIHFTTFSCLWFWSKAQNHPLSWELTIRNSTRYLISNVKITASWNAKHFNKHLVSLGDKVDLLRIASISIRIRWNLAGFKSCDWWISVLAVLGVLQSKRLARNWNGSIDLQHNFTLTLLSSTSYSCLIKGSLSGWVVIGCWWRK